MTQVIKRTNVVMLKLLAISRNALVVILGVVIFNEHVSQLQLVGYSISLGFFVLYNYLQVTGGDACLSREAGRRGPLTP